MMSTRQASAPRMGLKSTKTLLAARLPWGAHGAQSATQLDDGILFDLPDEPWGPEGELGSYPVDTSLEGSLGQYDVDTNLEGELGQYPEDPNLLTGYLAAYAVDTNLEGLCLSVLRLVQRVVCCISIYLRRFMPHAHTHGLTRWTFFCIYTCKF